MAAISVEPCTFALFGALGDLALRKLFPALYQLDRAGLLHADTRLLALGREAGSAEAHLASIQVHLRQHVPATDLDDPALERFLGRLSYLHVDFLEVEGYQALAGEVAGELPLIAYFATAAAVYGAICENLDKVGLAPRTRVVLEKPLGRDLASAKQINREVGEVFEESQIYRIDHYLGKETVQNLLALRFGITFLLLSPALRHLRGIGQRTLMALMGTGVLLFAIFLFETFGVLHTRAANAAFLISLCVVLTPLVEWALLKRRPGKVEWTAVSLSLLGALLLTGDGEMVFNWGDGLILLAALFRALQVCLLKRVTQGVELPALTVTAVQAGVVALGSIGLVLMFMPQPVATLLAMQNAEVFWSYVVYLVLACTLFAFFAQNYAIKRSSPTRVALLMGSEPAFGALFAMFWLGEKISAQGWVGGALIVGSALAATVRWRPAPPLSTALGASPRPSTTIEMAPLNRAADPAP